MNTQNRIRNAGYTFKKFITDKRFLYLIGVFIVLIGYAIFICVSHVNRVVDTVQNLSYENVYSNIDLSATCISDKMRHESADVLSKADVFRRDVKLDREKLVKSLQVMEFDNFAKAAYIENDVINFSDGRMARVDASVLNALDDGTTELYMMLNPFMNTFSLKDGTGSYCMVTPVYIGATKIYILGMNTCESLFDVYENGGETDLAEQYVVDAAGGVIASYKNGEVLVPEKVNFYQDILRTYIEDDYDYQNASESIRASISGGILESIPSELSAGRSGFFLCRALEGTNGWGLVYFIDDASVDSGYSSFLTESFFSVFGFLIILLIMIALVIRFVSDEERKMYEISYVDSLTNAPNESAFIERVGQLLHDYPEERYMICCVDILNFRYINEGYGHAKADMLLKAMTKIFSEAYSYNETYARRSADCFITCIVDDGRIDSRRKFIQERLAQETAEINMNYPIRLKSGMYYVSNRHEDISDMIDKANLARKAVDVNAKELVEEYRDQLMEETRHQEQIESRMEEALINKEFVPFLQPKWDMEKDHICGAEALVRWKTANGGVVPPGEFIPLFEKNGFIEKVDFYMLESICAYLRQMLDEGRAVYPVSINQSRFLLFDPGYISNVQEILLKYKIPKGLVELELTETVFFHEKERMISIMKQLKEYNMELSIDDFGSGYSSLNLLRDIPFDVLKIDREFLDESVTTDSGKWILQKIVEMADGLNLRVICEGVETQEQVDMLLNIGCKYAQGFKYSRPIPLQEFIDKYNVIETK